MTTGNQERIQQIWVEITQWEKQKESGVSLATQAQIDSDIASAKTEIARLEAEDQAAELQKKVEDEGIAFNVPGVDMTSLPHELIQLVEIIVKNDRKRIYAEEMAKMDKLSADHKEELRAAAEREVNFKFQNDELQKIIETGTAANNSLIKENGDLRDHSFTLNAEKLDLETRLRNAAAQIEEQNTEIDRLSNLVFEYQQAKVNGGVKEKNVIDVTPESVTEVQGLVDAIAKKYVASNPIGGNWHEIVAEDGSKEVVHEKDLPSIAQQESPFQPNETTASNNGNIQDMATNEDARVEAPTFQTVQAPPLGSIQLQGDPVNVELSEKAAKEYVTRGEFERGLAEQKAEILAEIRGVA